MTLSARSNSVAETRKLAAAIEPLLRPRDLVLLSGDLGGGKTAFVQGLAAAMGIAERITSPTFVLAQTYEGRRLKLHHLDVYRLNGRAELVDLDLPGLLNDRAVTAIEWGERVQSDVPRNYLLVRFNLGRPDEPADARVLDFEPTGPSWESRAAALAAALKPAAGA